MLPFVMVPHFCKTILALDVEELLAKGQYHEAVLPLPTCNANTGCRTVIKNVKDKTEEFNLPDLFHIQTKVGCP